METHAAKNSFSINTRHICSRRLSLGSLCCSATDGDEWAREAASGGSHYTPLLYELPLADAASMFSNRGRPFSVRGVSWGHSYTVDPRVSGDGQKMRIYGINLIEIHTQHYIMETSVRLKLCLYSLEHPGVNTPSVRLAWSTQTTEEFQGMYRWKKLE